MSVKAGKHARELLLKEYRGVLSTHSKAMPGFPFGSVVPYCLDAEGRPLILISRIAQHTHNLGQDAKCSLDVYKRQVLQHGLAAVAEARRLDGGDLDDAAHVVDDQGSQGFAFDVFSHDQQRTASLGNGFQYRQQFADVADLLVDQQQQRAFQMCIRDRPRLPR